MIQRITTIGVDHGVKCIITIGDDCRPQKCNAVIISNGDEYDNGIHDAKSTAMIEKIDLLTELPKTLERLTAVLSSAFSHSSGI